MGMESGLWDDSALVRAFDDAMTKYKVTHGKCQRDVDDGSKDEQEIKDEEDVLDESRNAGIDNNNNSISGIPSELHTVCETLGETPDAALDATIHSAEAKVQNNCTCTCTSKVPTSSEQLDGCAIQEMEYNQLISRYNELEMQKQQVLGKIYQASYPNYQPSNADCASPVPWSSCCCSRLAQPLPTYRPIHPCFQSVCYPCSCQDMSFPCQCSSPETFVALSSTDIPCANITHVPAPASHMGINPCLANSDVVTSGIAVAERALASMKMRAFDSNKPCEDERAGLQSRSDTGLSDLLSAWYSAGFYTGKYLVEQSIEKISP